MQLRQKVLGGAVLMALIPLMSCSSDGPEDVTVTDGIDLEINVDNGEVGTVIDVRDIFRKGYVPTEAQITFPDHPDFNSTLEIDPVTQWAGLLIRNDSLSESQKTDFAAGVAANIVIRDGAGTVLADRDYASFELTDSNVPVGLQTDSAYVRRPLDLREDQPYLLQIEAYRSDGVLTGPGDGFDIAGYSPPVNFDQQFYFTATAPGTDTYTVGQLGYPPNTTWCVIEDGYRWIRLATPSCSLEAELVLEQDEDGWVRIRLNGTDDYVVRGNGFDPSQPGSELLLSHENDIGNTFDEADRFRIISDNIDWTLADRGTIHSQPIMPPARLDFAFEAILRNCSSAGLSQTVGRTESRERKTTASTSESFQLLSSQTDKFELKVSLEVTAKIGVDVEGIGEAGEEVKVGEEVTIATEYTTELTESSTTTYGNETTTSVVVSTERTTTVPPFTAVQVYDAVKTIRNVRVPFVQVLRISGRYKDGGQAVLGDEIATQMLFNFVGGVISNVGTEHLDMTIRGHFVMDQLLKSTTDQREIVNACN